MRIEHLDQEDCRIAAQRKAAEYGLEIPESRLQEVTGEPDGEFRRIEGALKKIFFSV